MKHRPDLFPDVNAAALPRDAAGWVAHYCHRGDIGIAALRALLRALSAAGFEQARRRQLQDHFALTDPPISEDQLDKFLYQPRPPRISYERLEAIVRYLWDAGLLPAAEGALTKPADAAPPSPPATVRIDITVTVKIVREGE